MIEFYPQIKWVHVAGVMASVALFALRGGLVLAGRQRAAHWLPLRWTSWAIDTVLLSAALMLLTILPGAMFANGWLAVKVTLVVVYIVLGVFALKRAKTRRGRVGCYIAALLVFFCIYSIARAHSPFGFVTWWLH